MFVWGGGGGGVRDRLGVQVQGNRSQASVSVCVGGGGGGGLRDMLRVQVPGGRSEASVILLSASPRIPNPHLTLPQVNHPGQVIPSTCPIRIYYKHEIMNYTICI